MAKPQDDTITLLEIGREIKRIDASISVLKIALALQLSGLDQSRAESWLKVFQEMEQACLTSDPQVRDSELLIRALRAWNKGQA